MGGCCHLLSCNALKVNAKYNKIYSTHGRILPGYNKKKYKKTANNQNVAKAVLGFNEWSFYTVDVLKILKNSKFS